MAYRRGSPPTFASITNSFLFIPYDTEPDLPLRPVLGVGWTLNQEMSFYAIFALSLILSRRRALTLIVSMLVGMVALGSCFKPLADTSSPTTALTFICNQIIILFAAGAALGIAWKLPSFKLRKYNSWAASRRFFLLPVFSFRPT